jgi:hypothetical protein
LIFGSGPFRLVKCLDGEDKMLKRRVPKESESLRARALNCHRLAAGADDPEFTRKLTALAKEYEAEAISVEVAAAQPKK